jgi:hypothetical protein
MNRIPTSSLGVDFLVATGRFRRSHRIAELAYILLWPITMTLAFVVWRAAVR